MKRKRRNLHTGGKAAKIYITLLLLFMYLPIFIVILYSFNKGKGVIWQGFSTQWYQKLVNNTQVMASLKTSIWLAFSSALMAAVIGTLGAIGMSRSYFTGKGVFENLSSLPVMIPEIILALAYLAFFTLIRMPTGAAPMVIAHTTFCIPYIYINVRSRLSGLDPSIEDAARDLGAGPARLIWDITLPLIAPAVLSGSLLAVAMSLDDVVISVFLSSPTVNPLPVRIFSMIKTGVTPDINALCTLMLLFIFIVFGVASFVQGRKEKQLKESPATKVSEAA